MKSKLFNTGFSLNTFDRHPLHWFMAQLRSLTPVSLPYSYLAFLLFSVTLTSGAEQIRGNDPWETARIQYQETLQLIRLGRITHAKQLKKQLRDYPLYPYLDYALLRQQIKRRTPSKAVADFLTRYQDTPLAPQLKHHWLRTLARRGQWQHYLAFYNDQVRSTELKCYALWAQYKTANNPDIIVAQAKTLWLSKKSQPRACDPIFKVWVDSGRLTDELAWQRFSMAMQAGNTQLARYLIRYMSVGHQEQAKRYRELHFYPARIQRHDFGRLSPVKEEILLHALRRLAAKDAVLTHALWEKFDRRYDFGKSLKQSMAHRLIVQAAKQNQEALYNKLLVAYPYPSDTRLIEAGTNMAIRLQRWQQVINGITALPEPTRKLPRWQYWLARAAQQAGPPITSQGAAVDSHVIYAKLARQRNYYGFLAADHVNLAYQLNPQSYPIEANFLEKFKRLPGIIRAQELYRLDQQLEARREWALVSGTLTTEQHYAAAHYALQLGWHSQAIRSAIKAERWHDLKLRFPLHYAPAMQQAASQYGLNSNWLLAIARQESAMTIDARSPRGALGLMQVLPTTAKAVARKHRISYRSPHDLLTPGKNIEIATAYLQDLLDRFQGNSIYATAAYNAGPHRVAGWLKGTEEQLLDIWIENIPFSETRQYVKNVLAYSVIFAQLRGEQDYRMATQPFISQSQAQLVHKEK